MAPRRPKHATASATALADDDRNNVQPSAPLVVLNSQATAQQTADYLTLCAKTRSGITDTLGILELHRQDPDTSADDLRYINAEYGDQVAKKSRVAAMRDAFIDNTRAMRPPTQEMMNTATKLLKLLDDMTANSTTAEAAITTSTQLFKTWRNTEVS